MQKDETVYWGHMIDQARKACRLIEGRNRADFDSDESLRLALTYVLQTIGEAARKITPEFKRAHPEIDWPAIIGMRHRIVHDYLKVDVDIVWKTVTEELPELIRVLTRLLPPEESSM